jgi:hypothetical protein
MKTKGDELSAILAGKTIYAVSIETPNDQESIDEVHLERDGGIPYLVDGNRVVFTLGGTSAIFELLEGAEILTNWTKEDFIVVTLATNGGLQIKCRP